MLRGKYISHYYKRYAFFFIAGILTLIAVDWFQLYIPELLGKIVELLGQNYTSDNVIPQIIDIALRVLAINAGMLIGRIIWRVTLLYASTKIENDIRIKMFEKAERLSLDFYQANKVGTVLAWFTNDTETVEEYLGWGTLMLVDGIFLSGIVIVKMILLDWFVSIVIFVPVILIVIWGMMVEKYMSQKWEKRQQAFDELYDYSQESFAGIRVIKAFVKETQQLHHFAKIAKKNKDVEISFARLSIFFDVCIELIIAVVFALLMGIGGVFAYLAATGQTFVVLGHEVALDAASLVVFTSYFAFLIWPLIALGQVITMHSKAKASMGRISNFLDQNESIKNVKNPVYLNDVKGKILFKNFTFKFPNSNVESLSDISLEINPGEVVGVVGRIGCGKSTLVNSLARLYNVNDGTLFVDDVDIMQADFRSLRSQIAYVTQDNFLFSDSIKENILFSNVENSEEIMTRNAELACVANDINNFSLKYETILGERGVTLSGGQKQRVSIARAFVKNAPILVLDDSVSAVDVKTEEEIIKNIRENRKNKTTLIVASRVSTVSSLDKIIVLNEGKLEAFDTPEKLYKCSPTYKTMVDLQKLEKAEGE